jgi:SOS response regulatory protein OraA/RecX
MVSMLKLPEDVPASELKNLADDLKKGMRLYERRFSGSQLQEKLINFLLRKGYNYSNIKRLLKESHHAD